MQSVSLSKTGMYVECKSLHEQVLVVLDETHQKLQDDTNAAINFIALLKAYTKEKDLQRGSLVHAVIVRRGLIEKNLFLGNTLVSMYAKCGALKRAQELFHELPARNLVSWNALITGYVEHGYCEEAINYFAQMQLAGISPDPVTLACVLKSCGSIGASTKGQEIHAQIIREHIWENHVLVANGLLGMYSKLGSLEKAQEVFDMLPIRDIVSWNALISGYAQHERGEKAVKCFNLMQQGGFTPDAVTFTVTLNACGRVGALRTGEDLHDQIVREDMLQKHIMVANALIDMYAKCGAIGRAQEVFNELHVRDLISWNALILGYVQRGHGDKALNCFEQMQAGGLLPNADTFACVLKTCGDIKALGKGQEIHVQLGQEHLLGTDIVLANALVGMYAKCGALVKAQELFDVLSVRNIISWTALIGGYAQHGHGDKALACFKAMQLAGYPPNVVTFASILKACGSIGALDKGQELHAQIARESALENDVLVSTALVDMYAACGMLAEAETLFDKLSIKDLVSWSVLMVGYAQLGNDEIVLRLFDRMIRQGSRPNSVTCLIVLNACSRIGFLDKGQSYFEFITKDYGVVPTLEHHTCMVDLFGHAGHLDKAKEVVRKVLHSADLKMWLSVLSICRKWGDTALGRWAFEQAMQVDEKDAAAYVCMRNIYAAAGRQC